ncbi:hypothetical protein J2S43_001109 [Catenuloplanes nepalensis]|uniref:Uncharacterized protein n=1 Tax=Catenuloplanes nepalensis TaxID=587533 RepID=A0ABT9MMF3_9ACTN|nr:hypothetical protein [Catenuloplanes nepalensis]MDP9792597.1 hypothetical protein [Catenuloplanes nepalensis]
MPRYTLERAWQCISALGPVDAGRLIGHCLRYDTGVAIPPGTLTAEAADTLHASLYPPPGTPVTGDTIFYVVSSDRTPVAWLTYDATVVTPAAQLTAYQKAHQQQAVHALSHLSRHAVYELAKLRDHREQRTGGQEPTPLDTGTRILVAAADDPTLTWWAGITADLTDSLRHLLAVTHAIDSGSTSPDTGPLAQILIINASGYGDYGRKRPTFDLPTLCAIEQLAGASHLPAWAIGDWLHHEGVTATDLTAAQIVDAFTSSYAGVYDSRRAFATAERDRHGWTTALTQAGIPLHLFDLDTFSRDLFSTQAHDVRLHDHRVAVFRSIREAQS